MARWEKRVLVKLEGVLDDIGLEEILKELNSAGLSKTQFELISKLFTPYVERAYVVDAAVTSEIDTLNYTIDKYIFPTFIDEGGVDED
jgi:hypothetical protein